MTRVFRRGELKQAILEILADCGASNGYGIMAQLAARVGGKWRPSPGAVYPALVALHAAGLVHVETVEGVKLYALTPDAAARPAPDVLVSVASRHRAAEPAPTLGQALDHFAATHPHRRHQLSPAELARVEALLDQTSRLLVDPTADPASTRRP